MGRKNRKKKKISDSPQEGIAKTKDIWGISIGLFGVLIGGFSLLLSCTQVTEINELNRKVEAREVRENTPDVNLEINLHRDFIAWNLHSRNAEAEIGYTKWFKGNKQIRGSSDIYLFQKDRYEDFTYIPDIEFRMISPGEILSPDTKAQLLRINRYEDFDKLKSELVANSSLVRVEVCVCSKIYPKNCYAVISANIGRTKVNRKDCLTQGPVIMDPTNILINNTYLNDLEKKMMQSIAFWLSITLSALSFLVLANRRYELSVNDREYDKRQRFSIREEWFTEPERKVYQTPLILASTTS